MNIISAVKRFENILFSQLMNSNIKDFTYFSAYLCNENVIDFYFIYFLILDFIITVIKIKIFYHNLNILNQNRTYKITKKKKNNNNNK